MRCFHFLLPNLLGVQGSLTAVVELLYEPTIAGFPARVTGDTERLLRELAIDHLHPQVGIMVMRPEHDKARSVKHCTQLAGSSHTSVAVIYKDTNVWAHTAEALINQNSS